MATAQGKGKRRASITDLTPHFDTLPDVARRLRRRTEELGADHFAVFLVDTRPRRLRPSLDSDYPGHDLRTARLAECLGDRFIRRAEASTLPFWWIGGAPGSSSSAAAVSLSRCAWAERIDPPAQVETSLALPLAAERGDGGLMVVSGDRMELSTQSLSELHAFCLLQFGLISRLRPTVAETAPQMSRREVECLKLTANGCTSDEIATRLGLSVHTTNQYLTNSSQKLNAVGRVHAVAKALRLGLID